MKRLKLCGLAALAVAALIPTGTRADAPLRSAAGPITMFVKGTPGVGPSDITPSSSLATPLWATRSGLPAIAPDGHQLTLGEWINTSGRGTAKCSSDGTHVVLHFSGLVPKGVYTVWAVIFNGPFPAGPNGIKPFPFGNLVGVGALGANDGSENSFQASASGEAEITAFMPTGLLSDFGPPFLNTRYDLRGCLLDETAFHFVAVYHFDGKTYGPSPGFQHGGAEQIGVMFDP